MMPIGRTGTTAFAASSHGDVTGDADRLVTVVGLVFVVLGLIQHTVSGGAARYWISVPRQSRPCRQ